VNYLRKTRAIDYINILLNADDEDIRKRGRTLYKLYLNLKESLSLNDLVIFIKNIENLFNSNVLKNFGRFPQSMGQFRAYAFEEYVYDLIKTFLPPKYNIYWNDKIRVRIDDAIYEAAQDIIIRNDKPIIVIEVKVDVDAQRLKACLMNFMFLKKGYRRLKTILIYMNWNASENWKKLALKTSIDRIFWFNSKNMGVLNRFKSFVLNITS